MPRMLRIVPFAALLMTTLAPSVAHAQFWYPPYYYPHPVYRYEREADVRIRVNPSDASVYVDGYFAGKVEDFDGVFQRLHALPGQHEIVIYKPGYRSLRQRLYLTLNHTHNIDGDLDKLGPGETDEPEPRPIEPPPGAQAGPDDRRPELPRGPVTRRPPAPQRPPEPARPAEPRRPAPPSGEARSGTLVIRVQPSGATVLIDGEKWNGPTGDDERLIVQVPSGRHHVEVEKDGYERYTMDVEVERGRSEALNISLRRN